MKTQTKKIIKKVVNLMLIVSITLFAVAACLIFIRLGFGIKLEPPFCWASFLQMGLLVLTGWAFNKELFFY
jgi:hypothetical protein